MVASLIGVIIEATDATASQFGETYSYADIGSDKLGNSTQCSSKPE